MRMCTKESPDRNAVIHYRVIERECKIMKRIWISCPNCGHGWYQPEPKP